MVHLFKHEEDYNLQIRLRVRETQGNLINILPEASHHN